MAFNGDETEAVGEAHKPNSYFEAFDGIVAALDALAKAVTPDGGDDGTPPEEGARPCCNSYFASFRNITDALARLKSAVEERIAAGGGTIPAERLPAGLTSFDIKTPFIDHTGAQLYDKAVNVYSFYGPSTSQNFRMPPKTAGKARSFMLRLTMTVATEWTLPQDVHYESDDESVFAEIEAGTTAVFMFTETSDNLFMVSRKNVRLVSKG